MFLKGVLIKGFIIGIDGVYLGFGITIDMKRYMEKLILGPLDKLKHLVARL